ncbi:MAG: glycoside hydrolase family 172 protein [bacterium]
MKKLQKGATIILACLLIYILNSCNPVNRVDIERLLSPAALPYLKQSKLIQVSSYDTTGGNNDRITISPGKKATILNVDGPGLITRIWFTVDSRDPYYLRRIVLRIYWDKELKPSVEVPLGDFFGNGFSYTPYISSYLGMTSGGFVCYFPMPFEGHARMEIANETMQEIFAFYYQIDYQKVEGAMDRDIGYFHALWKRDIRTNYDSSYVLFNTTGQGHVVGINMNMQSYDGTYGYLEGDEKVFVDNEKKPSIHGTGTEDYFSGGWYFRNGTFSGPYSGLLLKNDTLGRISAYRLHILDPIPFKKSIKFTIEHGHGNEEIADYSSTAYWYQIEPHKPFPPFPSSGQRIPLRVVKHPKTIKVDRLKFNFEGLKSYRMDMTDYGPEWVGNKQVVVEAKMGSFFKVTIPFLTEVSYDLDLYYTKGPDYGNAEVFLGREKIGEISGYSPFLLPSGKVSFKNIKNTYRSLDLTIVISGKDTNSRGYKVGIDGVFLEPKRDYIPEWLITGPFPNPRKTESNRLGLDSIYPPENGIDPETYYGGADGKPIRWHYVQTPENGYISLVDKISPNELVVTYAVTYLYSAMATKVSLFIGSDDGCKVFFNNKEIYRYLGVRVAEPDQAEMILDVHPGWNKLLLKVENNLGGYGFFARILDPEKKIITSARQENPEYGKSTK